jgi:teichoic acid transport system ATP-binding protein
MGEADVPNVDSSQEFEEPRTLGKLKVVVDDVHVTYRVWTSRTPADGERKWWQRGSRAVPTKREVHAVRGISFEARQGETIGIIGRNGSGKSTLLRAIAGLIPPNQGTVYADGQPTLLGVSSALVQSLTGARNIELGLLALGMSQKEIASKFDDIVEFSGLGKSIHMPMSTYSSGMGARLKFAIATAITHDILLIDEALSTGDSEFVEKSAARIEELRDEAEAIFLVSHSASAIRAICDRAIWIDAGQIVMDGPTEEVLSKYLESVPRNLKKDRKQARRARKRRLDGQGADEDGSDWAQDASDSGGF